QVVFRNIRNAYSHELAGVLSKGHLTDAEVAQSNAGVSEDMGPAQIGAAMAAGQKLMQDKINQQYATAFQAAGKRIDPYFKRFGLSGGPPPRPQQSRGGAPAQPPRSPAAGQPPVPGARQRSDGRWFVQQGNQWFEVK